jgi:hypothetical protein
LASWLKELEALNPIYHIRYSLRIFKSHNPNYYLLAENASKRRFKRRKKDVERRIGILELILVGNLEDDRTFEKEKC